MTTDTRTEVERLTRRILIEDQDGLPVATQRWVQAGAADPGPQRPQQRRPRPPLRLSHLRVVLMT